MTDAQSPSPPGPKFKLGDPRAGRPHGSTNKRTRRLRRFAEEAGVSPLAEMIKIIADPATDQERRDKFLIAAAPYIEAKPSPPKPNPTPVGFGEMQSAEEAGQALAKIAQMYVEGQFDGQAALIVNTLAQSFLTARYQTETERRLALVEGGEDDPLLTITNP
jgi:hypothetical protein